MRFRSMGLLGCSLFTLIAGSVYAQDSVVKTTLGSVAGVASDLVDGVTVFKGIRYGADMGGANRFLPPQPPSAWEGVYNADSYGNSCYGLGYPPFLMPEEGVDLDKSPASEDCLFLNVWTPGLNEAKRPVMVWLHGGGFSGGSGGAIRYESSRLASKQDVVVITLNHRLASLGFMDVSALGGDEYANSGNAGMLDIVQALQWVRDNAAAFGGDPDNVTVFGQSGGGSKVSTLLSMPEAQGLFHRAIAQSGLAFDAMAPEAAQATAKSVFDEAQVTDIAGAQALDVSELLLPRRWGPVKSPSLPRGPFAPDADPAGKSIPFMLGSTKTESTFANATPTAPIDDAQLRQAFVDAGYDVAPDRIDAVMAAYRAELPGTPDHEVFQVLGSDLENTKEIVDVANLRAEQMAPTYVYYFAQRQGARDGALNVPHTAEIAYVFDNLDLATALVGTPDADDRALADMMSAAWANFARTGNPNGEGVPNWPEWTNEEHSTMIFAATSGAQVDPFADRLRALEAATAK